MKASLIQRQLKLNAQVLTGLHEEYAKLRTERKKFNEMADRLALESLEHAEKDDFAMAGNTDHLAKDYREQAAIFDPYIKKFSRKIKNLEQVQKALKGELKVEQFLDNCAVNGNQNWSHFLEEMFTEE